jgi:choloylglycine hydrolase
MCTSISYTNGEHHYFGRNLDLEIDYPVDVVISPRNYAFNFRHAPALTKHYAMIGMAMVQEDYPLYFEGINEKGLGMAGLAFAGMAYYEPVKDGAVNISTFEFIPYILGQCTSVAEAREKIAAMNLDDVSFAPSLPTSPLHWIIADVNESIVVESTKENGLKIYDNPFGVLTNCPEFDKQSWNVSNYINVTGNLVDIRFAKDKAGLSQYSRGMGSIGLPGGVDSSSRFVRVAFTKANSISPDEEDKNVSEFFHILGNVQQVSGETEVKPGQYEITQYTCCGNTTTGMFYYTTYYNQSVNAVDMHQENLDDSKLFVYPVIKDLQVNLQNKK